MDEQIENEILHWAKHFGIAVTQDQVNDLVRELINLSYFGDEEADA